MNINMDVDNHRKVDSKIMDAIKVLLNEGHSQRSIAKTLHIGRDKVSAYIKIIPPEEIAEVPKEKMKEKEAREITEARTVSRYTMKGGEYLSDELLKDLKISMETAKTLKSYEMRYRASVEKYGIDWNEFIGKAIEGYFLSLVEADALLQDWKDKQRERLEREQKTDETLEWVMQAATLRRMIAESKK